MTNAKRLWFRNLNQTWIPLPQGADNDNKNGDKKPIRSVNIYDSSKKRWLNPGPWGAEDWHWGLPDVAAALRLRSDVDWQNYEFNPNPTDRDLPGAGLVFGPLARHRENAKN